MISWNLLILSGSILLPLTCKTFLVSFMILTMLEICKLIVCLFSNALVFWTSMRHILKKTSKEKVVDVYFHQDKNNPKGNKLSLKYQELQNLNPLTFSIFLITSSPLRLPHKKYHGRDLRSSLSFKLGAASRSPMSKGFLKEIYVTLQPLKISASDDKTLLWKAFALVQSGWNPRKKDDCPT